MGSDSDDSNEADIPSAQECNDLCRRFIDLTETNLALAMFFLQSRNWSLEMALEDYFKATDGNRNPVLAATHDSSKNESFCYVKTHFKLLSWNVDGLTSKSLSPRTQGIVDVIKTENPDVVFFQELVDSLYDVLSETLEEYENYAVRNDSYFCAIFWNKARVKVTQTEMHPFPSSLMGRNMLLVKAKFNDIPVALINTHLESTKDHASERINQLRRLFELASSIDGQRTVIFGGDLNLRDSELDSIGGLPPQFKDLWVHTGSRPECLYTWDLKRNTNLQMPSRYQPRMRFDRLYIRLDGHTRLNPVRFELTGLQRPSNCSMFCSDHWAVQCLFEKA